MATVQIAEYEDMAEDARGEPVAAGMEPRVTQQTVTYTTSTQTAALNRRTRFVLITTDGTKAHFRVGVNPTSTAADPHVAANGALFIGVRPNLVRGGTLEIAFYDGSS